MSWKFKVSKYKNAAPRFPKKEETILDIPVGRLMNSCGNHIASSCVYMAFNVDAGGGCHVGLLPLDTTGRVGQSLPALKGHVDYVTDMAFSPFNDQLLATCSADTTVKIWSLPEQERLSEHIDTLHPSMNFPQQKRVENVLWNPVADNVLAVSVNTSVKIYDVESGKENFDISSHEDQVTSMSWRGNGTLIATTCKDKKLRILDPRANSVVQECQGHASNRESRAVWIGDTDFLVTTGVNAMRDREIKVWDSRNFETDVKTEGRDNSTGTLMPLLDEDTNMLFVVGKADTSWSYYEVSTASPYLTCNSQERTEKNEQIKGACLVPKLAMNVMEGEVDRLLLLIKDSILSLPVIVPRRQYKDFHADLFPDTKCAETSLSAAQWCAGENGQIALTSLDPAKRTNKKPGKDMEQKGTSSQSQKPEKVQTENIQSSVTSSSPVQSSASSAPVPSSVVCSKPSPRVQKTEPIKPEPVPEQKPAEPSRASQAFAAMHLSKCKFLKGVTAHPSTHIVNIRKLCRTLPGQSNLFCVNSKRCAVPIEGSGGLVAILELDKPVRLPDAGVPVLQNGSKVNDFVFDPFDPTRILVGCDNAKVMVWKIPQDGLTETLTEYQSALIGHMEKIYFVRFHPLVKDIVVTAAYDMALKIWDLTDNSVKIEITAHTDEIFCAEWSPDGRLIATVCKDGKIRIFDPRKSTEPIKEGEGPEGSRGARVIWAHNMKYLVVSGFSSGSMRVLMVYDVSDLSAAVYSMEIDMNPAILVPEYDPATSTLYMTGRGDTTILTFEVSEEYPHLFPLSSIKPEGLHQSVVLLPPTTCDVKKVEIAHLLRLTKSTVEPITVTVPRVKPEYFQDDLYMDIIQTSVPLMSTQEWFSGVEKQPVKVSLRPAGMKLLSEAPVEAPKAKKYDSFNPETYKTDEMKKEELISAMTNKLDIKEDPLPQDVAEGVDSDEWEDY